MVGLLSSLLNRGRASRRSPLPTCATSAEVALVQRELGSALPTPLRQLYLEVADGGFGPGTGLYSLDELLAKNQQLSRQPLGRKRQPWAKALLAVEGVDWDVTAVNVDTGVIVRWDVEELEYGGWDASFKPCAEDLRAWLQDWMETPLQRQRDKAPHASQLRVPSGVRQRHEERAKAWLEGQEQHTDGKG